MISATLNPPRSHTGRPTSPNKLGQMRREILLAVLTDLAEAGKPMLDNPQFAAMIGADSRLTSAKDAVRNCFQHMERAGLIKIEYKDRHLRRRVTILATGKKTDWQPPREYNTRKPKREKRKRERASMPLVFQLPTVTAGYSDSILYGADADVVRALRRAGDTVWMQRLSCGKPTGQYVVNSRFLLDSVELRERAAGRRRLLGLPERTDPAPTVPATKPADTPCRGCGAPIGKPKPNQRYCGPDCQGIARREAERLRAQRAAR